MKKIMIAILCILILIPSLGFNAQACWAAPMHWEFVFEDSDRVFIMSPTSGYRRYALNNPSEWTMQRGLSPEERAQIRSGLYYNTYPLISIYYVDEYFAFGTLFFSSDGIYLAELRGHGRSEALRFFANGVQIRSYSPGALVIIDESIVHTSVGPQWLAQPVLFDQQANTLTLTTVEDNTLTFDITTGDIISRTRPTAYQVYQSKALRVIIGAILALLL